MKIYNFIYSKLLFISFLIFFAFSSNGDSKINEYVISLVPEQDCKDFISYLINKEQLDKKFKTENYTSYPHIPMYFGAFNENNIHEIDQIIRKINPAKFSVLISGYRIIDNKTLINPVRETFILKKFHESMVQNISKYSQRMFSLSKTNYKSLSENQQRLTDKYGYHWVMASYKPYLVMLNSETELKNQDLTLKRLNNFHFKELRCDIEKFIIAELDDHSNITGVVATSDLK